MGNEEDEEPLEEIPRVRMNPKRIQQSERNRNMKIQDMLSTGACAACVEGRGVGGQHRIGLLEEEERERTIVAFDYGFPTGNFRHISKSDLPRQQVWSNASDML